MEDLFLQIRRHKTTAQTAFEHFLSIFLADKLLPVILRRLGYQIKHDTSILKDQLNELRAESDSNFLRWEGYSHTQIDDLQKALDNSESTNNSLKRQLEVIKTQNLEKARKEGYDLGCAEKEI